MSPNPESALFYPSAASTRRSGSVAAGSSRTMAFSWKVGSRAPDHEYTRPGGTTARFSDLWSEGPALFVWLRHCG